MCATRTRRHPIWKLRGMMTVIAILAILFGVERFLYHLVALQLNPFGEPHWVDPMPMWIAINVLPISLLILCVFGYIVDHWRKPDRDR